MKSIKERLNEAVINEDSYPAPDFNRMTPPVAILELMSGKTLEEVLPKIAGWPIIGVYYDHKDKFPDVDKNLLKLLKH